MDKGIEKYNNYIGTVNRVVNIKTIWYDNKRKNK